MCKHGRDQLFAQVAIGRGFDNLCPILLRIGRTHWANPVGRCCEGVRSAATAPHMPDPSAEVASQGSQRVGISRFRIHEFWWAQYIN